MVGPEGAETELHKDLWYQCLKQPTTATQGTSPMPIKESVAFSGSFQENPSHITEEKNLWVFHTLSIQWGPLIKRPFSCI